MAVADVNGDGRPDIIVANHGASTGNALNGSVSVLLGNGNGTFQPAQNTLLFPGDVVGVAVADINGDGRPDLIVGGNTSFRSGVVSILLGNANGTFQGPPKTFAIGGGVTAMSVADVNRDGRRT